MSSLVSAQAVLSAVSAELRAALGGALLGLYAHLDEAHSRVDAGPG